MRCKSRFAGVPAGEYKDILLNTEVSVPAGAYKEILFNTEVECAGIAGR